MLFQSKPAALIVRPMRVSVSAACALTSPLFDSVLPRMPATYKRLPTRMAELRFGFFVPGLPSAPGVVKAVRFAPFTAIIVISTT